MTTAFITGITGMVGSHLVDYLYVNTDWNIHGLIRWRSSLENLSHHVVDINSKNRFKLFYGDLRDSFSIEEAIKSSKPNYIFHLAAQSFPKTSFISPMDTLETNINGTFSVLESAKKYVPEAIVHVCSSSEIFGRVQRHQLPISEDCTFHPASPYAISKVGTDLAGRFYAEAYGSKILITRMFTHTGPRRGDVFAESSFAKQIALAESNYIEPIIKVGNLKSLRTIADVRDAVDAYYTLVTVNPIWGEYYNIGGNRTLTVGEILEYLISISKLQKGIQLVEELERLRPIDADLQIPDISKFTQHTGWTPKYSFETTMQDLLEYWRSRVASYGNTFLRR